MKVAEIRPDYVRDAVQKALPAKVSGYSGLQTAYPDYDTAVELDAAGQPVGKVAAPAPAPELAEGEEPQEEVGDFGGHDENTEVLGATSNGGQPPAPYAGGGDTPPAFHTPGSNE